VADQVGEHGEHLRLEVAGDPALAQLLAALVELAVAEPVDHPVGLHDLSMASPRSPVARRLA